MAQKEALTQIVKMVQKDMTQFEVLYTYTVNRVYYWCYTIVKDETLAHDLTQESMIKLYYKFHTLKNSENFITWMYTLVRNLCYSYLSSNKNEKTLSLEKEEHLKETVEEETDDFLPQESYNLKETKQLIIDFIRQLPRRQQEVISLYYLEEFSVTEIGRILEYNAGSVKSRLYSGRKNLEKLIDDYQEKHQTKLYSTILLPLLGEILQQEVDHLPKGEKLKYDESLYKPTQLMKLKSLKGFGGFSGLTLIMASVVMVLALGTISFMAFGPEKEMGKTDLTNHVVAADKSKKNPYIHRVMYNNFPTRQGTQVRIELKKTVSQESIEIALNGKTQDFEQKEKELSFMARENGTYTVSIKGKTLSFEINCIDPNAPELIGLKNHESYLELILSGEETQLDYEKSYVQCEGKTYKIEKDFTVIGEFHGTFIVYLYNHDNQYVNYEFKINGRE